MQKYLITVWVLSLVGCTQVPSGPSALVLPGDSKNESQFRADDRYCRTFAHSELLGMPFKPDSQDEAQRHFDIYYLQCMYGRGHLIPVSGEVSSDAPAKEGASKLNAQPAVSNDTPRK